MAKKAILNDGESYVCPYCEDGNCLYATVEAIFINVPFNPDGCALSDGICVEDALVKVECGSCGKEWLADEITYAEVGE